MPHRCTQGLIFAGGVGQRDAGTAATEIADRDDAAGRDARVGTRGEQRRRGVRDQQQRLPRRRPFRNPAQCGAQCVYRARGPVSGIGDCGTGGQGVTAGGRICQRPQRIGHQCLAAMHRPVGRDDADLVPDAVHEVADHQTGLIQPRVLRRQSDLGWTLSVQRQYGLSQDGAIGGYRRQIGGTDR